MTKLFFQLIQVAVGNRESLSRVPSAAEWGELYTIAKKQALVGIAFAGVNRLRGDSDFGSSIGVSKVLYLKWLGMVAKIQQRNRVLNVACVELVKQYTHDGLSCCILKGQGNLVNYSKELREARTPGDIDVWCSPADPCGVEIAVGDLDGKGAHYEHYSGIRGVIEYVKMLHRIAGTKPQESVRYHHIDAPNVGGVSVEVHTRPIYFSNPLRNYRLQRWFEEFQGVSESFNGIPIPSVSFNVVYQLAHINHHLFEEGIGLRQLLDYYFVLRALHVEQGEFSDRTQSMAQWAEGMGISVMSNQEIMHQLKRFGLNRLARAVMYVLAQVFEPNDDPSICSGQALNDNWASRWPWMICEPDERLGKHLLEEVMLAGNFGKYDTRIKRENKRFLGFKVSSSITRAIEKTKRNLLLAKYYPGEALWEPPFRLYHFFWRKLELWKI